jgi:polysaccharide chain length determinant protein (PEP-CTERM system associated)
MKNFDELIGVFRHEVFKHRNVIALIFIAISLSILLIGVGWPKKYKAASLILVDQKKIIQPLTEGVAVPTEIIDFAQIARELIYGRKIMNIILKEGGWLKNKPSAVEQGNLTAHVTQQTEVSSLKGSNLIKIEYSDEDPVRAAKIADKFAELLLAESMEKKGQESGNAFEFLDKQMQEYHKKLLQAETRLKEFRSKNISAQPGTEGEVMARVNALQERLEQTKLELAEALSKKDSLEKQLAGEAEMAVSLAREEQYAKRIAKLQAKFDKLRLNYHDAHPNVIQVKHQVEDLAKAIASEKQRREAAKASADDKEQSSEKGTHTYINPLYGKLRSEISALKATIDGLKVRIGQTEWLLNEQLERGRRIHISEAILAELTRDYEVNRDIHQQLLRRREYARVSKSLDKEGQGLNMRIYERAVVPVQPYGPRFMYFALGGLILGTLLPLGLVCAMILYDPRVRFKSTITEKLNLPVLATIPHLSTSKEVQRVTWSVRLLGLMVLIYLGMFAFISWLKFTGVLTLEVDALRYLGNLV